MDCLSCGGILKKNAIKYCSTKCQINYERSIRIQDWLEGKHDGRSGKTATVNWIKWYLIQERGEKCEECNWNKVNEYTGNIPIELEHIDGDFTNNKIGNLKLLCPNCHSLTKTYKGANKNGRPRSQYFPRKVKMEGGVYGDKQS